MWAPGAIARTRNLDARRVLVHGMNTMSFVRTLSVFTLAAGLAACGGADDAGEGAFIPAADTLYLPTPEDLATSASGLTATEAGGLCASDSRAYQRVVDAIAAHNEVIQSQLQLLQAVKRAARIQLVRTGVWEHTVTSSAGRSLTLVATMADDGAVAYEATFSGPNVAAYTFLTGATAADQASGTWTFRARSGDALVEVAWQRSGDDLTVTRELVGRGSTATYVRAGDAATITITDDHTTVISWSVSTKAGQVTVDGAARVCWDAMLCTMACS